MNRAMQPLLRASPTVTAALHNRQMREQAVARRPRDAALP